MRQVWWIVALTACRQIFGLDDPTTGGAQIDARLIDGVGGPGSDGAGPFDGRPIDAPVQQQPLYVQGYGAASSANPVTMTYPYTQEADGLNVVAVGWLGAGSLDNVTDSAGNSYTRIGPVISAGGNISQAVYYAAKITGGSNTVSVSFATAPTTSEVGIVEYRRLAATLPIDNALAFTATSATVSGTITTSHDHDLIVAINASGGGTLTPEVACTLRLGMGASGLYDREVLTAGTYHCDAEQDTSTAYVLRLIAFAVTP